MIWFCGLPGSGKSTLAKIILTSLKDCEYVSMDEIRSKIFLEPRYDDRERDAAYRSFVLIARFLSDAGKNAILDGTGHRLAWREFARKECETFIEVYLRCPIEVCIERETGRKNDAVRQNLYRDALERLKSGRKISGLGKVPGVDEPFEESQHPEISIDATLPLSEQEKQVKAKLVKLAPEIFP